MKVIIPVAGKGSRMRPHTLTKPKCLLPIAGKTNLDHVIGGLKGVDISEFIFITGYLKEQFEEYFRAHYDIPARFIEQKEINGPGGAVQLGLQHVEEPVLILYVDTVFDVDTSVMKDCQEDGIIWAQEVEDYQRFGVIVTDENDLMVKIVEKPDKPISKLANIGLYYFKNYKALKKSMDYIFANKIMSKGEYFPIDAFQHMVDTGSKIKIIEARGWYDTGKPETTLASNAILLKKMHAVKSKTKDTKIIGPVYIEEGCVVEGATIGPNVSVARGCTIKNAHLQDCILDEGTTVQDIKLTESILGENTVIEGKGSDHEMSLHLGDYSKTKMK